ncbi:chromosome segregation protein [Schinkia sp. CFF1]
MRVNSYDNATQNALEERFEKFLSKLDDIERQLSQKADDIVSFQILQHRGELEELETRLSYLEMRMDLLTQVDETKITVAESYQLRKKPFMNKIASIFTL